MMAQITFPIDEKTEDAINEIRTAGREPIVFTDYQVGKGRVLVILDDEESKTKTKQCIICGVFKNPKKMVKYGGMFTGTWRAHKKCMKEEESRKKFMSKKEDP